MATQKKRRMDDDPAPELAGLNNDDQVGAQLPPHLREEPADPQSKRIAQLKGTLKHLRGWMQHVQDNMQANGLQKDTVFNARRLFVGGIPAGTVEAELTRFIADALRNTGAAVSSTGQPISYCRIQPEKNFAFVEVRSAEEASNTMALDGIVFKDIPLKIKRPSKYDQAAAFLLGPTDPDPTIDLSKVEISRPPTAALGGAPAGAEGEGPGGKYEATPNTLYIGGLPIEWNTDQCMELLKMYGEVKYFRLMMDRTTGNSRGFAFAEYTTDEATIAALAALDGAQLGPRRIAANRMLEHKQKQQQGGFRQGAMGGGPGGAGGQWGNRAGASGGMGRGGGMGMNAAAGRMVGYGGQQGGMAAGAGGGGDGMVGYGAMGGMQQGQAAAAAAGMQGQAAAGYGMGAMGAGYGMGQQQQQQVPQQTQQGYYGSAAAGGMAGAGMNAMNGTMNAQTGMAGAAAGGMGGYNAAQQGMYGINQAGTGAAPAAAAAAAAGSVYDGYGSQGQMQQGAGMYGNQMGAAAQQQQPGMMGAAGAGAGMGMAAMGAAAAGGMGMGQAMGGMGAGYGQQQEQQQQGYAAGMGGMPQLGAGGQMGAGYAAAAQPVPPPRGADPGTGMGGGNMATWAGQWPAGSQQMQNWG